MLLTRDEFRNGVFKRDNYKCVICGKTENLDAHHILERRCWPDGGYYLSNGATVCPEHHILAEQTILSCEEIRAAAGIKEVILPEHLYAEYTYDKWSNIVLPDGRRIKGELFYDESVQKIIAPVIDQFSKYVKYPRTMHLPWSQKTSDDDRILTDTKHFEGKEVVVSVKMDGENSTLYNDFYHARSIEGNSHASQSWIRNFHAQISYNIPEGWRICGENLYAKHTIPYKNLASYFMLFSVWNEKNECLGWDETKDWAELLEVKVVPVIYEGIWDEETVKGLYKEFYGDNRMEGYVVRVRDKFSYGQFRTSVAKYVDGRFKEEVNQSGHNWRYRPFTVNKLEE